MMSNIEQQSLLNKEHNIFKKDLILHNEWPLVFNNIFSMMEFLDDL
jgi:hypothetical protein